MQVIYQLNSILTKYGNASLVFNLNTANVQDGTPTVPTKINNLNRTNVNIF